MHVVQQVTSGYRQVGPHRMKVEPPDIIHIHFGGDVLREHFQVFYDTMGEIPEPRRPYILRDARNGGFVTPDARKYISTRTDISRVAAVVTYGASFHTRTVLMMMNKAMRIFSARAPELVFFNTHEEAMAWIEAHRQRST